MTRSERRRQQEADAADDQRAMNERPNEPALDARQHPKICAWSRFGEHRYHKIGGVEVCEFCTQPRPPKVTP
jgi:hypothetical protein